MPKMYNLGNGKANIVLNYNTKKEILTYLFSNINLSKYRFQVLTNKSQLQMLKTDEHFVSPNFRGKNYLILFMKLNGSNKCFMIDRRKLKYSLDDIDYKDVLILQVDFKVESVLYNGTILDGKLLNLENSYAFICNDCYYLFGNNMNNQKLNVKYETLNKVISIQMDDKPCYNFDLKINKLYKYTELENLVKNIIPKSKLPINGIVFYPKYSGTFIIFSEKSNKPNVTINKDTKTRTIVEDGKEVTNFKVNNISNDESYHIVRDLGKYLKSRVDLDSINNTNQKIYWLRKTDISDVYHLQEKEDSNQSGIAHVPNMKISHMLCDKFKNNKLLKFKCYYDSNFKKWVPFQELS